MSDVLSQNQIDELLRGIVVGEVEMDEEISKIKKKKIKEFNFKIPRKFTKEQLRTLVGVYDIYSRHLSSYLTGALRTFCEVEVVSIEETKYYEYSNSLSDSALMGVMNFSPFEGTILMELSKDLSFTIIDKLLGGKGNPGDVEREYTDIELGLIEKIYRDIIPYKKYAWANVVDIEPSFKNLETNNGTTRFIHFDEIVVILVLKIKINDVVGKATICLPYMWLECISDKLYTKYRMTERTRNELDVEATKKSIMSQIYNSGIYITANLGSAHVNLRDLLSMEVGDVIRLNQNINQNIKINVNNKTWFYGVLGVKNNRKAIEVKMGIKEEEKHG